MLLSVGASDTELAANIACGADVVCIDLEDTVTDKSAARALAASFHQSGYSGLRGLRINPLEEEDGLRDILMVREASWRPDIVVMTMVKDAHEVVLADRLLPASCRIIALVETAEAVENAGEIARASQRLAALMFGGKDLAYSLGSERSNDALDYSRGRMMVSAAAGGVRALDENYRPLDDLDGLAAASTRVKGMGYRGRLTIDARHVPIINSIFAD
ncbi:aldolase/citrate lyase family protein [Bradyrhizobium sp. dw_78]|uniref:HpcH/HpaI aldolase/citrate lyase family protein n=1 Tax=Bradyrhizobium sp. dw_78 TaxID=2719793 RepID=UPI001BD635FE